MNELQRYNGEVNEICEVVKPFSVGLASALKNFLCGPSDKEIQFYIMKEAMKLKRDIKMEILKCIVELAKLDQLSDEKFRLLMIAFAG